MRLKIITPPATEPLTLDEVKHRLRVSGNDDDALISSLIVQAREYCEEYQKKKYITQTLEAYLDSFPIRSIEFDNCSPVQSVVSIKYIDSNSVEYTVDSSIYQLDNVSFVNKVDLKYCKMWPAVVLQPSNGIVIRFTAGYGNATAVPETVKWAMTLHIRLLYDDYTPVEREKLEQSRDSLLKMNRVMSV